MVGNLDYTALVRAAKKGSSEGLPKIRVALLSDATTQLFLPLLRELFRREGFAVEFYEAPFAGIELAVLNPAAPLYAFQPDFIVILNATQALRSLWPRDDSETQAAAVADGHARVWDAIGRHSAALIVQSNYVLPYERSFGNYDLKRPGSWYDSVAELNRHLAQRARAYPNVLLNDVEAVASWVGRRTWFDERFWDLAKSFCASEHLPAVAQNITRICIAARGRTVKCVVLDLDNTLWGGIVGDDGVDGIRITAHGDGEAFHRFQLFLLGLKRRGILLCVCSKNEYTAAIAPFESHPEMVLRREDITVFTANWDNKADNIKRIREALDIGYDSMVFLDDNPFERALVRGVLPEVIVPELPEDPADYGKALAELNLFETTTFSGEDTARAGLYQAEFERRAAAAVFTSVDEYLASLEMKIRVARFEPSRLARIAQLLQRSNQFNLTTHRYNQAECERMMLDPECTPLYASLRDRFGDHGLISIVVARPRAADGVLAITDWLMSCRVLTRGVEEYLMSCVVREAQRLNLPSICGEYIPTAKNAMVKDFFARFGFEKVEEAGDGRTRWILTVAAYVHPKTYLQPETEEASVAMGSIE